MKEEQNNQISIELPEEVAEGVYTNLAVISHSQMEFILDFIRLVPNVPQAKVKSRVIMTPQNAKRLVRALQDNIKRYEAQNGVIQDTETPQMPPMNFNTPPGMA